MDVDGSTLARTFLDALATKDREGMTSLFVNDVDFRGLTPSDECQATTPDGVADIVFGWWFEPLDIVRDVESFESHPVLHRTALRYRLIVDSEGAPHLVEQQGFLTAEAGRIGQMSLVCSGYLPLEIEEAATG
jgi:hypothetical protein